MNTTEDSFIDTSVIISREFGKPVIKEKIKKLLTDKRKTSTTYTLTETNRSILKDAVFLHSLLIEEGDLSAVFIRLQSFPLSPRRRDRCLQLLSKITDKLQLRLDDSITRLEAIITGMKTLLYKDIVLIETGALCPLSKEEIHYSPPNYQISTSCTRDLPICNIKKYLEDNLEKLIKINEELAKHKSFDNLRNVLGHIFKNTEIAKGRNCMRLGDIIICLDSSNDCDIYSTNVNDFKPICKAIGKTFIGIR